MDTRTGEIHDLNHGETLEDFTARLIAAKVVAPSSRPQDFVEVKRRPDGKCAKCNGTGAVRKGLFSRRFKPCACVL